MATRGTVDLCSYLLPDAGSILESEVITLNRRNTARGRFHSMPSDRSSTKHGLKSYRARYWNAGHILDSASIELEFAGEGTSRQPRVIVSGDIGPDAKLPQPDP